MHKKLFYIIIGLAVVVGGGWMAYRTIHQDGGHIGKIVFDNYPAPQGPKYFSQLDGTPVASEVEEVPQVLGVMIDNHPDARPQSGLDKARIVYEAPAEGGITRFLAIFAASDTIDKVGPVRSARPYFIDWIREYGTAPYLHCGGSPAALDILATDKTLWDANQFWLDPYFWRSSDRLAPHNLYTSSTLWQKLIANYSSRHEERTWAGWKFDTANVGWNVTSTATSVAIPYMPDYEVEWSYNTSTQHYERFINNRPHKDQTGIQLQAHTVVVQMVNIKILDDYGRKEIDTVSSGEAWVLRGGKVIHGSWKKETQSGRTRFYNENGAEIAFAPGQVWVQVVPKGVDVKVKN